MCGIVGYIGEKNCLPILLNGLKKLEYRGYDSAGIAYLNNNKIKVTKTKGRIKELEKIINKKATSPIGIGHTRWATHGKVNTTNSHPHQVNNITIVHNGILENYQELKDLLQKENYTFKSETDTEVLCAYIDYEYQKSKTKNIIKILENCLNTFKGSYAIAIIIKDIHDKIFVLKKESPLVIIMGKAENYIASDISAYQTNNNNYISLEDNEIGIISKDKITIYKNNKEITPEIKKIETTYTTNNKAGYDYYMEKEINEQPEIIKNLNNIYLNNLDSIPDITNYQKIHIIGCGTAYHAGLIGKYLIEKYNDYEINVYISSEYRYQKNFIDNHTLIIAISQSGETADTIACLKQVKKLGCPTIGIVNVKNSSIARIVDNVIYTNAGQEVSVASTKAYLSQTYILSLIALKLAIQKNILNISSITNQYQKLPNFINQFLKYNYEPLAKQIYKNNHAFYLGRNIDYAEVLEGSLKLKEISYIHSEAYQAGELKHGTISLIEKNTCIISLITNDKTATKTISNIKEVKTRGAYVILLIKNSLNKNIDQTCYDQLITIPDTHFLIQPLLNIIPLQLLAYHVARKRGCDIDKPRNLAKSVTVE